MQNNTNKYMEFALQEAHIAQTMNEVPIGAVIVHKNNIIAKSHNKTIEHGNFLEHAEILALKQATITLSSAFLNHCDIYITMEPCLMCAYAICMSRIGKVYFGCFDTKNGAFGGAVNILQMGLHITEPEIYGGIKEIECAKILRTFFKNRRQ